MSEEYTQQDLEDALEALAGKGKVSIAGDMHPDTVIGIYAVVGGSLKEIFVGKHVREVDIPGWVPDGCEIIIRARHAGHLPFEVTAVDIGNGVNIKAYQVEDHIYDR
jgi:hypothetical protein